MFRLLLSAFLFLNISLVALETSETAQKNHMLADLSLIKRTFEYGYAPAEWKREFFGWDLQKQFQSAVDEINTNQGNDIKQFQKSLVKFCRSTRDYHVSIAFASTEYSFLPFDIRCRNGNYIVVHVKQNEKLPLAVGDEILTMNGIPIADVVTELQKELGEENRPATDRALALEILTKRIGRLGHQVPQGSTNIEIKKPYSDKVETYQVEWNYKPERVLNPFINKIVERQNNHFLEEKLNQKLTIPYYEEMAEVFSDDGLPKEQLGSRKSVFSTLGKEKISELIAAEEQISWVWNWSWQKKLSEDAKKFFDARLIELPSGKRVGYVRISTYTEKDPERALEAFVSCIEYFQDEAEVLLIDQINNPGGCVIYMYALASVLTDRPLETLKEKRLLTQNDVYNAIEIIDNSQNIHFDQLKSKTILEFSEHELALNKLNLAYFVLNQWNLGHFLTEPYPALGIETIKPHPRVNFTKPIFILVNEKAFSCGEAFPAILQDNQRATIIGMPTAGAMGAPCKLTFTNFNGIQQIHYTTSITYRCNGLPLENLGITPDIFFDFNNEMYDKDNVSADFRKIYDILDNHERG